MTRCRRFVVGIVLVVALLEACALKAPLVFTIEEVNSGCHKLGERIPIKITFQNTTGASLTLYTDFLINPGSLPSPSANILHEITTNEGERLSYGPYFADLLAPRPVPNAFVEIPPQGNYDTVLQFPFPLARTGQSQEIPLPDGQYHLRLKYQNDIRGPASDPTHPFTRQSNIGAWVGGVWSNQITICIQH